MRCLIGGLAARSGAVGLWLETARLAFARTIPLNVVDLRRVRSPFTQNSEHLAAAHRDEDHPEHGEDHGEHPSATCGGGDDVSKSRIDLFHGDVVRTARAGTDVAATRQWDSAPAAT